MNLLISAYSCEPNVGSEPEVGWKMVTNVAKLLPESKIHVIVKERHREGINKQQKSNPVPSNVEFIFFEFSFLTRNINSKLSYIFPRIYYYFWMIGALNKISALNIDFDIIHHVTYVNDWLPSFFYKLKNKNNYFIWGPIGSNDSIGLKFHKNIKSKIKNNIIIFLKYYFRNIDPWYKACEKNADVIFSINESLIKNFRYNNSVFIEPAIGIDECLISDNIKVNDRDDFIIISVGKLIDIKNHHITLHAFSDFLNDLGDGFHSKVKLKIIGSGPQLDYLKDLSKKLGVEENVVFSGSLKMNEVYDEYNKSDLFVFSSLENAGFVTLEAMSQALPVVCLNYGGAKTFVKEGTDFQLVDPSLDFDSLIKDFSKKIKKIYFDKSMGNRLGLLNKETVRQYYTWESKAIKMVRMYRDLILKRQS